MTGIGFSQDVQVGAEHARKSGHAFARAACNVDADRFHVPRFAVSGKPRQFLGGQGPIGGAVEGDVAAAIGQQDEHGAAAASLDGERKFKAGF